MISMNSQMNFEACLRSELAIVTRIPQFVKRRKSQNFQLSEYTLQSQFLQLITRLDFKIYGKLLKSINYKGPLDTKQILNFAARYLHSNVIEITPGNIETFINDSPSVPKVLLFTDKKGIPTIFKGLSVAFEV